MAEAGCHKLFRHLSSEAVDLYLGSSIKSIDFSEITPLKFYREYVSRNIPVIIKNSFTHWKALENWNSQHLSDKLEGHQISVAITPNGYADAITDGKFMLPFEAKMAFNDFTEKLESKDTASGVYYIQKQNSNMTTEFPQLLHDIDENLSWATDAFGSLPDAVNFWMGDERAVTSMHKDHYENIYCVVRGEKTFTLIPPTDQVFIPYIKVPVAKYNLLGDGIWDIQDEDGTIPWIAVDPLNPDFAKFPDFRHAQVYTVKVKEGEALYLPSLWYHHVQQSHGCIAVNYWYDMQYDIKYNYYQFVSGLLGT